MAALLTVLLFTAWIIATFVEPPARRSIVAWAARLKQGTAPMFGVAVKAGASDAGTR